MRTFWVLLFRLALFFLRNDARMLNRHFNYDLGIEQNANISVLRGRPVPCVGDCKRTSQYLKMFI